MLNYFLGISVKRLHSGSLILSQQKYILEFLDKANMLDAKLAVIPICSTTSLSTFEGDIFDQPTLNQSIVGGLQYLTLTRLDLTLVVNKVCQFMTNTRMHHWIATKIILRYLKGTLDQCLEFKASTHIIINAFVDADWASSVDDRKSTSGICIFFGANPIIWSAKKQSLVARSSTKAKYHNVASATFEILWLQSLLLLLHFSLPKTHLIWCDDLSSISLTSNPILHPKMKHIELDFYFVQEKVLTSQLLVQRVPTNEQTIDIFTKPLSGPQCLILQCKLSVHFGEGGEGG